MDQEESGRVQLLLGEVGEGTRPRILEVEEHGVGKEGRVDGVIRQSQPLHQVTTRGPGIGVKQALEALDLGFEVGAKVTVAVVALGSEAGVSADGSVIDALDAEAAADEGDAAAE